MHLYMEFVDYRAKYLEAQRQYDEILNEKEQLFETTQPKAVISDKEKISGGKNTNSFDDYLITKERKRIDERLLESKKILDDRELLLKLKERELRESNILIDKIYCMRYLDEIRVCKIARIVNYSEAQIYRALDEIKRSLKLVQ